MSKPNWEADYATTGRKYDLGAHAYQTQLKIPMPYTRKQEKQDGAAKTSAETEKLKLKSKIKKSLRLSGQVAE